MSFANAGKKVGLEAWRIENFEAKPWNQVGTVFSGDCFIFLQTREEKNKLCYTAFYWIGANSSQDEQGALALRTTEMTDQLQGRTPHNREVQGHESEQFLRLFPKGLVINDGGIDSGFTKVVRDSYKPRLFQLKGGARHVRCSQVELAASSLNDGDVFILDLGLTLYQWNGKSANKYEKFNALQVATRINDDERGSRANLIVLDSGRDDVPEFWSTLGGSKAQVKSAADGGDDNAVKPAGSVLYRVSDASGSLRCDRVAESGSLSWRQLDGNDVFLLDVNTHVFVWVGKGATKEERTKSMDYAVNFLKDSGRPTTTPICRLPQFGETPQFRSFFPDYDAVILEQANSVPEAAQAVAERKIELDALYKRNQEAAEKMIDDAKGNVQVWRIVNRAKQAEPAGFCDFDSGDCFIVVYSTPVNVIIYYWIGQHCSIDERGSAALLTVDMEKEIREGNGNGVDPSQVRVTQGKEPAHFLALFKGNYIVHTNATKSAPVRMFRIHGTNKFNTKANEVDAQAANLSSNDCFVVVSNSSATAWLGNGATADERATAVRIAGRLGSNVTEVVEGSESAEFWDSLGGKTEYYTAPEVEVAAREPRLFHLKLVSNVFQASEVHGFTQEDLIDDDVMLLDTYSEVYVWIGQKSAQDEQFAALNAAVDFVKNAPDGRSQDTPIYRVKSGSEPVAFTVHFGAGWNKRSLDVSAAYNKLVSDKTKKPAAAASSSVSSSSAASSAPAPKAELVTKSMLGFADPNSNKYTLAQLKGAVPDGVDPSNKELYLNDDEFNTVFGMNRGAWAGLKQWRKDELKKAKGLF